MRIRRTVKERDIVKVWVFGYDRKLIKSAADSGFRNKSEVFSCSEDPFHPLGVGMYAGDYYPHRSHMYNFGKRVKDIDSLPKKVIEFIKYITR